MTSPAVASTTIRISANLDSGAAVGRLPRQQYAPGFRLLGASHTLTVTYTMTAAKTWAYTVTMPTADLSHARSARPATETVATGTLAFSTSGALDRSMELLLQLPSAGIPLTIPPAAFTFADGAAALPLTGTWRPRNSNHHPDRYGKRDQCHQHEWLRQRHALNLRRAARRNHQRHFLQRADTGLGQVAVASFSNNQGLVAVGNNNYQATAASGAAVIGLAGTGGRGTVIGGTVEQSNVNIATEFAKLIVAQQAYSANAKSITTFNQVSQATIAMLQ